MTEGSVPPPSPSVVPPEVSAAESPPPGPDAPRKKGTSAESLTRNEGLDFVMDVPIELSVEIGRRVMKLGEILRLGPGSILELDKANGEPLDVYANKRLVARGEAVVVGERYGIRLKEVLVTEDEQ